MLDINLFKSFSFLNLILAKLSIILLIIFSIFLGSSINLKSVSYILNPKYTKISKYNIYSSFSFKRFVSLILS